MKTRHMEHHDGKPELYRVDDLHTYRQWYSLMEEYGHIWFYVDGTYYFLFPEGPHKYGLCLGEDERNGNMPRWEFNSEDEFINAPLFDGKNVLERSKDILSWDPPFFSGPGKVSSDEGGDHA